MEYCTLPKLFTYKSFGSFSIVDVCLNLFKRVYFRETYQPQFGVVFIK